MLIFLSMIETEEDKTKFQQIYEKYSHFMWYIANEMLWDAYLAEDAVQESFLALTRHLDKVANIYTPQTKKFLATITKSKALDIIRKRKGVIEEEFEENVLNSFNQDMLNQYLEKEAHETIVEAIEKLDEIYRTTFEYKYIHELSDKEIADLLGVTPKVVNVRIFRARKKLQEILSKGGEV